MLNSGDRKNLRRKDALKGSAGVATVWMLMAGIPVAAVGLGATIAPAVADVYSAVNLTGQVVDADGTPVAGATVKVTSATGITRTATSDANGNVTIPNLPQGEYKIEVSAGGFQTASNDIKLTQGASSYEFTLAKTGAERVVVLGARRKFDFDRTTRGQVTDVTELQKRVPLSRDVNSVAQLAPSTTRGDDTFGYGNQTSISGASVGENVFYVNGLNVTNFRNFIGGGELPWEFYDTVETKTGGFPAEFGRGTGGVINAISKSGSNDWHYGVIATYRPDWAAEDAKNTFAQNNSLDERNRFDVIGYMSGALIEDKLFFYVMAQGIQNDISDTTTTGTRTLQSSTAPSAAAKIDYNIADGHRLELTWFDTTGDSDVEGYTVNPLNNSTIAYNGHAEAVGGMIGKVAKYTGQFNDWFSLSALYGTSDRYDAARQANDVTGYRNNLVSPTAPIGLPQPTLLDVNENVDTRELFRVDADFLFELIGVHHVRVGYDIETLDSTQTQKRAGPLNAISAPADAAMCAATAGAAGCAPSILDGGSYAGLWQKTSTSTTGDCNGAAAGVDNCFGGRWRYNMYQNNGSFSTKDFAWYVQDSWRLGDLTLLLGIRNEGFENRNLFGEVFVEMTDQWAPRLGFSWDVFGDGKGKAFGSYSTYYLPIANNTNVRLGGAELYARPTFSAAGLDGQGRPTGLVFRTEAFNVFADGTTPTELQAHASDLESFEESEWTIGYQHDFDDWRLGLSYTHRELQQVIEDIAIDEAVQELCALNGWTINGGDPCSSVFTGFHQYVLINPGKDATVELRGLPGVPNSADIDQLPGTSSVVTLSAAMLGVPTATRTLDAVEFTFERVFDGTWGFQGSYTWMRSKGNYEGAVKSDVGQDDAALTQDFDQAGLMENAYGFLPNHREHTFKVFGTYAPFENFLIGANYLLQSPRKFGCMGIHPTDPFAGGYGPASWYCQGVPTPRGSQFESDWRNNLDLSFVYTIPLEGPGGEFGLRADVFNVINTDSCIDNDEVGELTNGAPSPTYQACSAYQNPRSVQFQFSYRY